MDFKEVHKLTAIVFTDLVGFTDIMEHSEQDGLNLLKKQREFFFPIIESHNGVVLKEMGDGLLLMFDSSIRAVRCAIEIQKIAQDNDISLRIGVHIGDIIVKKKDIIGSGVNIASRIEPLAPTGGICISEDVWRQIRNQKDLYAVSIGKRELKGVKHPIEIFELTDSELADRKIKKPLLKNLWQRRVPQILAIYFGACWAIIEFVTWLTQQYLLSPHLINLGFITLLSFIPTTILIAYFHGKPGKDNWTKVEKIGIPFNVLFSIFLLVFLFHGKELGSITQTVTAENEEGVTIERVIPKSEFRKNIGVFFFENTSADSTLDWMQYALSYMIDYDLSQDMFLNVKDGYEIYTSIFRNRYQNTFPNSIFEARKIAKEHNIEFYILGSFKIFENATLISISIYKTATGNMISMREFKDDDIFILVDEISVYIKRAIKIQIKHIEDTPDYKISEIFTNSIPALKIYFEDGKLSIDNKSLAIKIDSTFAEAYLQIIKWENLSIKGYFIKDGKKIELLTSSNIEILIEENKIMFKKLFSLLHKLPEYKQFYVKALYYNLLEDYNNEELVLEMWEKIFPDDLNLHQYLAEKYMGSDNYLLAINEYKKIIKVDDSNLSCYKAIGNLYKNLKDNDKALEYLKEYLEKVPENFEPYKLIGDLYFTIGEYDSSMQYFQKGLILDPENYYAYQQIGKIEMRFGNFEKSIEYLGKALEYASKKKYIYFSILHLYLLQGKLIESQEYLELQNIESELNYVDKLVIKSKFIMFNSYKEITEQYVEYSLYNDSLFIMMQERYAFNQLCEIGLIDSTYLDKVEKAINYLENHEIGSVISIYSFDIALINEYRGNLNKALKQYLEISDSKSRSTSFLRSVCRCYRKLNKFDEAQEYIEAALKVMPASGFSHYEYALLYQEINKKKKAIEELKIALNIWKDADPEYIPAQMAKEKLKELEL